MGTGPHEQQTLRIGAKVPNSGSLPGRLGLASMARTLEGAGFASLWVSDHVVMPSSIDSPYPFATDGKATWPTDTPYLDALVSLAVIAAVTETATIGTAVLVLPLRHPVVLAKQAASVDVISGGRLCLGVGAGWMREEFDALDVPFDTRGARFAEWIEILRDCWTGSPKPRDSERYTLPDGVLCLPTPVSTVPLLVGGHSAPALRRAGELGDGWLGQQSVDAVDVGEIERAVARMHAAASAAGRDPSRLEVVLRLVGSAGRSDEVARHLPALARAGVDEVIVDVAWDGGDPAREHDRLRDAVRGG